VDENSQPSPLTPAEPENLGRTQSTAPACPDDVERKFDVVFLFPTGQVIYVERVRIDSRSAFWCHWLKSMAKGSPARSRAFHVGQARAWLARLERDGYPLWTLEAQANIAGLGLQWFNLRKKQ
jgi:hypothetical protein